MTFLGGDFTDVHLYRYWIIWGKFLDISWSRKIQTSEHKKLYAEPVCLLQNINTPR